MKKPRLKKLKPKLPRQLPRPLRRAKGAEERVAEALQGVPRITNETVAEHREAVLETDVDAVDRRAHQRHRDDADDDAERRQHGPHRVGPDLRERDPERLSDLVDEAGHGIRGG